MKHCVGKHCMSKHCMEVLGAAIMVGATLIGCSESQQASIEVERLPDVRPNLPEVPTLPPPPHPIQYEDGSYSVYGLRKRIRNTMDTEVEVTGYIASVYAAPECPEGETCPRPSAPHMWLADTADEAEAGKRLAVVGYAANQTEIDEAMAEAARGQYKPPPEESGLLPIPTDFVAGNKVKVKGRFTRVSGSGFNMSDGLLEYAGHETLQAVEPPPGEGS